MKNTDTLARLSSAPLAALALCWLLVALLISGCGDKSRPKGPITTTPTLAVITTDPPAVPDGAFYSIQLSATGAQGATTWSLVSGTLPTGLTLNPNGNISGTATISPGAQMVVRVRVTDAVTSAERDLTFRAAKTVTITSTTLQLGTVGQAYAGTLSAVGGTQPYTWSVVSGTVAPGVVVGTNGLLSGTPTQAGTFQFTVRVTDTVNVEGQVSDQKQVTLIVQ